MNKRQFLSVLKKELKKDKTVEKIHCVECSSNSYDKNHYNNKYIENWGYNPSFYKGVMVLNYWKTK